jgi:3'-phosphoadenosine 5'-phosphosulfate sulfotransferase (PAPS reductase)/FAD synthetase
VPAQLDLLTPADCGTAPVLTSYDYILVNSSAGKDSQAMLDMLVDLATTAGVLDRLVVVHCDLGRVEWPGTRALAERQARHYGLRFEVVSREQGLLEQIEERGMWPDAKNRYCTSDHKRDQVAPLMTALANEHRARAGKKAHCRILNCQGLRAQESRERGQKSPFTRDTRTSNGLKTVDIWYPIYLWTLDQVWARITASGVEHHPAYDLGMKRLSCVFCVFADAHSLTIAGRHNPALLDAYCAVEERIGHQFKKDLSIRSIRLQLVA